MDVYQKLYGGREQEEEGEELMVSLCRQQRGKRVSGAETS